MTIYTGDCLEVMRTLPSESVDSIVTDPPAGISFMSKHWDRDKGGRTQWVAWMTEVMRECYRLLVPGGYAVVWSLPRTCHWTAWAMEDAGFIIRDQLAHIFASGFPKGKAQLKPAREDWWLARKPGPLRPLAIDECRIPADYAAEYGETWLRSGKQAKVDDAWQGPPEKVEGSTVADRVNGNGRWPSNLLLSDPELFDEPNPYVVGSGAVAGDFTQGRYRLPDRKAEDAMFAGGRLTDDNQYTDSGGYSRFFLIPKADRADREPVLRPEGHEKGKRFSVHPTMKPTDLMAHLIKLVTPPDGVILDPFLGSGSTAIAAERLGVKWIGIEKEAEYVAIAEARLNGTQRGLGLDVPAPTQRQAKPGRYTQGKRNPVNCRQ